MNKDLSYLIKNKLGEDPNFNPARNRAIVESTIKATELNIKKRRKVFDDAIDERAEALASYLMHLKANKSAGVERYFGRKLLAQLRGDEIKERLMGAYATQKQ